MKKWEKEILQKQNSDQVAVLKKLKKSYENAIAEVDDKIQVLQAREQTQSVIYQLKYQQQLQTELKQIYDKMGTHWYSTIDEYLTDCYEDGFYQTMYSLHQEGIPLIFPLNQVEAVQAAAQTGDGIKLSDKLYQNTDKLVTTTRREITKGIAMGSSYADITRSLSAKSEATLNQAYRIIRTESHRIQEEVKFKTINQAKDKGADVVKQWDSSIDKRTRPSHAALDGQLREIDQPFKSPLNGHTAMYPGGFGIASEDIHCRCVCLQRARWALDKSELDKYVGDLDGMSDNQLENLASNLGVSKADLIKASNGVIESDGSINHAIKAQNYNQFKKKYETKADKLKTQLQSQIDVAEQEKAAILSKYHNDMSEFMINGEADEMNKFMGLNGKISDLQSQLGIQAPKPAKAQIPKVTTPPKVTTAIKTGTFNPKKFSSNRDAVSYHEQNNFSRDTWDNDFSSKERKAIERYTGSSYRGINGDLRRGKGNFANSGYKESIEGCTSALDKCSVADDVIAWRGYGSKGTLAGNIGITKSELSQMVTDGSIVGIKFTDYGFGSTGVIESAGWDKDVFLEVLIPKGTKGMYVDLVSSVKGEKELLLQRGTTYEILKAEKTGGKYKLTVQITEQSY